jgi:hypothetical protein
MPKRPAPKISVGKNIYRIWVTDRWMYQVRMQVAGRKATQLCPTFEEAHAVREAWRRGGLPPAKPDLPPVPEEAPETVHMALRDYVANLAARGKRTVRTAQIIPVIDACFPGLLTLSVAAVTVDHFYVYRERRLDAGIKPNTIIRDMVALRTAIKHKRPDFKVPQDAFPDADLTRVRMLTPGDEKRALLACAEPARTMAELAIITLMRQGELRTLRRSLSDWTSATVSLP